jgi:hypothetical protein
MKRSIRLFRFWLGRHLVHAGIKAFPEGRCKIELMAVLGVWGRQVEATLAQAEIGAHQPS